MSEAKYFHLYADNKTVKEISAEEWFYNRRFNKPMLVVRVVGNEIWVAKGKNSIHLRSEQLRRFTQMTEKVQVMVVKKC